jgi:hypothetical protein
MKLGIDFAGFPCLRKGIPRLFAAVSPTSRRVNAAMALPFPDILLFLSPVRDAGNAAFVHALSACRDDRGT